MFEQNFKWLFTLLPFVLSFLMRWSGTASLSNPVYKTLILCEYGVMIFWILAIGFYFGLQMSDCEQTSFDALKKSLLDEVGYKFANIKYEYTPLREEVTKLKLQLDQEVQHNIRLQRELRELKEAHNRTPATANKAALKSLGEV